MVRGTRGERGRVRQAWRWELRWSRRWYGRHRARTGCPGIWSRISTACTFTIRRSHGSFRSFRGLHLLSRDLATGFLLFSEWSSKNPGRAMVLFGTRAARGYFCFRNWLDARPVQIYAVVRLLAHEPQFLPRPRRGCCCWSCSPVTRGAAGAWAQSDSARGCSLAKPRSSYTGSTWNSFTGVFRSSTSNRREYAGPRLGLFEITSAMVLLSMAANALQGTRRRNLGLASSVAFGKSGKLAGNARGGLALWRTRRDTAPNLLPRRQRCCRRRIRRLRGKKWRLLPVFCTEGRSCLVGSLAGTMAQGSSRRPVSAGS